MRAWSWGPAAVRGVAGAAVVGLALVAAVLTRQEFAAPAVGVALPLVAGGALGVCGVWSLGEAHDWSAAVRLPLIGVPAVLALGVRTVRPTERVRLRARRSGELLESVGVVALVPLVIGVFGVYGQPLDTFA